MKGKWLAHCQGQGFGQHQGEPMVAHVAPALKVALDNLLNPMLQGSLQRRFEIPEIQDQCPQQCPQRRRFAIEVASSDFFQCGAGPLAIPCRSPLRPLRPLSHGSRRSRH